MKPGIAWTGYSRSTPPWMGTPMTQDKVLIPGGATVDPAAFAYEDALKVTVGAAGAAADATEVPVIFSHPDGRDIPAELVLPVGTQLDFGGDKLVVLTAACSPADATTLTVRALVTALVGDDTATYPGGRLKRKYIPDGILLDRTYAERELGTGYGPADVANDEQFYLLAFPLTDATDDNYAELYLHGNTVYEEKLPGWASLSTEMKAKIRNLYVCIKF